jgi:hypothetical protein
MSKIKNFFVRSETIGNGSRGLCGYEAYLDDMNHSNHKGRTNKIISIVGNNNNFLDTVVNEANQLQLQRDKAGKGGRPISSLAQSFVFAMPSDFVGEPSKEQFKAMSKDMLNVIADKMNLQIKDLKNHIKINVHMNESNPHINILVGRIVNGVNYQQQLTRPSTTNALKRETALTVKRHLGLDIRDYKPIVPPGTTKGARWDENRKYTNALKKDFKLKKIDKFKDFYKSLNKLNYLLLEAACDIGDKIEEENIKNLSKIKELTTHINKSHKKTFKEIRDEEAKLDTAFDDDYEMPDFNQTEQLIKQTQENTQLLNDAKKSGRKIRKLKLGR